MMKLTARTITKERTQIFLGGEALEILAKQIPSLITTSGNAFILVDSNTREYCLPLLIDAVPSLDAVKILEVEGGEHCKSLETAALLWQRLLREGADRNTLIINLGGGVVSDLGGFVAGGFLRGVRYINIPTSLIAQADAAIGGKTGVNLGNIKNQVGFFNLPLSVFVFPGFFQTLPLNHLRSGLAEIIKSILLGDPAQWNKLKKQPVSELLLEPLDGMIWKRLVSIAVTFKTLLVKKDFREKNVRKALNFGHTIGHALESHSLEEGKKNVLHGDAIAAGMICAARLSHLKAGLSALQMQEIVDYLYAGFPNIQILPEEIPMILDHMKYDKKNQQGQLRFTLLSAPGSFKTNVACGPEEVSEVLKNYLTVTTQKEL